MISLFLIILRRRLLTGLLLGLVWIMIVGVVVADILPERKCVVIDPGHGGIDGGTSAGGLLEKDVNLALAHVLRRLLQNSNYRVVMTRTDDSDVSHMIPRDGSRYRRDLKGRVKIARQLRHCALISLHANWHRDSWRRGAIVYYQAGAAESKRLAQLIQAELNRVQVKERGARAGSFFILRNTEIPGVIVEAGFLSNPQDRQLLQDPEYLKELAEAIKTGLERFLETQSASPQYQKTVP